MPPIPTRLVEKIQSGQFVELAELLPDHIGSLSGNPALDDEDKTSSKQTKRQVTTILEWVRCFSLYMAVIALKNPGKLPDLLGYQVLIVEARMEHEGDGWLGYDRRFRQMATAVPATTWAKIEPTLWNMAFAGKARSIRCKYCFGLSHSEQQCELAPAQKQSTDAQAKSVSVTSSTQSTQNRQRPICNEWNYNPAQRCPIPRCRYRHICIPCSRNPKVMEKGHKAMYCPNFPVQSSSNVTTSSGIHLPPQAFPTQHGSAFPQVYNNHPGGAQRFQPY